MQLDVIRPPVEQREEQPNQLLAWEFPRKKFKIIRLIGSGAFGEVWLAEAEGILKLNQRDEESEASERRQKVKRRLKLRAKERGVRLEYVNFSYEERTLVAVKTLKGNFGITLIHFR